MSERIKFLYRSSKLRYWKNLIFKKNYTSSKFIFIHVPKTSGTYLSNIFRKHNLTNKISMNSHDAKVFQLNPDNKYLISIREPFSRLTSSFYDAQKLNRQGKLNDKLYDHIFSNYNTFNHLCENIFNKKRGEDKIIKKFFFLTHHIITGYSYFFYKINPNIFKPSYIFEHENLENDIKTFLKRFNIRKVNKIDKIKNTKYNKFLSLLSKKNLKTFFGKREFEIYQSLKKNKKKINNNFDSNLNGY